MNSKIPCWFFPFATLVVASIGHAQEPIFISKTQRFIQTSAGGAVPDPNAPYEFSAQSPRAATLQIPGGQTRVLPAAGGGYSLEQAFSSKAALDAAFPGGNYSLTGPGVPAVSLNLSSDLYPAATPQITNGTWNAGGMLVVNPAQSYTFNLSSFATYASSGVAGHMSFGVETDNNSFEQKIISQAAFGLPGVSTPLTSVTLPANTLIAGRVYRAGLSFDTATTLNLTAGSEAVAIYANELRFYVAAIAPGGATSSRLVLFGATAADVATYSLLASNSSGSTVSSAVGAFPLAAKDAAVYNPSLAPGPYTVQISAIGSPNGLVIAELYDASPNAGFSPTTPRVVNVSVRKSIEQGGVLTSGFYVNGSTPRTVLIRAIGPALGLPPFGLTGAMPNPQLALFNSAQVKIAENDNWGGDAQLVAAGSRVGAFVVSNGASADAMLLVTLAPGLYTAQASGVSGSSGEVIVEVYEVP